MSPRQRIVQNTALADEIRAMLHSPRFEVAHEAALIEFVNNQSTGIDGSSAIGSHFALEGAKRFLAILTTIADTPKPMTPNTFGQLQDTTKPPERKAK